MKKRKNLQRKVLAVTGSRAEYGLMRNLLKKLDNDVRFKLILVATGSHLSIQHGSTIEEIRDDGFTINAEVEMLLSSDNRRAAAKSVGIAMIGFADVICEAKPDIILILGDRMELMSVATTAVICGTPIAHIHGGEITDGAFDDLFRHAITKMSQLHFASTETYRQRIIQMGERPENVFNVGALGVENVQGIPLLTKKDIKRSLGLNYSKFDFIVTLHPETVSGSNNAALVKETLSALEKLEQYRIIFTGSNADPGGTRINKYISEFAIKHSDRCAFYHHLGLQRYLSLLKLTSVVIGNSSSGIIEAPSFNIPTVNIGDRQKGRERAKSVFDCPAKKDAIVEAIKGAFSWLSSAERLDNVNPYERENTSDLIVDILFQADLSILSKKRFYDIKTFRQEIRSTEE